MKKLFSLVMFALLAAGANAQTWKVGSEAPAEESTLVDDELVEIKTVYATTRGTYSLNADDYKLTGSIQLRAKSTPNNSDPTGGDNGGSTPLIVTAKKDAVVTFYYRRQNDSGDDKTLFTNDNGKDVKCYAQNGKSVSSELEILENVSEGYANVKKICKFEAEGIYTIYATGTTIGLFCIDVSEPVAFTQAATPRISISCFDFTNKNYSMTITATGADEIWYSIDDAPEAKYDGAVALTGAEKKVEAYAKANGLGDSEKATEELNLATYDANKKYVAWAYQPDYNTNTLEDDIIYQALAEEYNVVPVGALRTDAPATICPSLDSADLLVVTEMMTGGQNFANGLKEYVGKLPIISFKAFNYTNGRWSWAKDNAPANHAGTKEFLPERDFVLFAGLVNDGKIALYTGETSGNTIQTSGLDGTDAPTDIVVMGTTDDDANKNIVAFYSANSKYFGLNLSCDNYKAYHENAATIVAKAAGMLIAGENLAEVVSSSVTTPITAAKYATFYAEFDATIPAGVTAYGTALNGEKTAITLTKIEDGVIPAKTAVILYSETANDYTFTEAEEAATETVNSVLTGVTEDTEIAATAYVLGSKDDKVGFYHLANGAKAGANQAYLTLPDGARVAFIGFDDNTVTAIDAMAAPATAGKAYNLTGVQAAPNAKGVVIVDGKKVVIK